MKNKSSYILLVIYLIASLLNIIRAYFISTEEIIRTILVIIIPTGAMCFTTIFFVFEKEKSLNKTLEKEK